MTPEKSLYSDEVMDHFLHPRNTGELPDATIASEQLNEVCGDQIALYVRMEGSIIVDARFRSYGCAVAIAAASMMTEAIKGKSLPEADGVVTEVLDTVRKGTAKDKTHCSTMVEQVWKKTMTKIRALELE
jgi:nitrogen fixation NifU-like protein